MNNFVIQSASAQAELTQAWSNFNAALKKLERGLKEWREIIRLQLSIVY